MGNVHFSNELYQVQLDEEVRYRLQARTSTNLNAERLSATSLIANSALGTRNIVIRQVVHKLVGNSTVFCFITNIFVLMLHMYIPVDNIHSNTLRTSTNTAPRAPGPISFSSYRCIDAMMWMVLHVSYFLFVPYPNLTNATITSVLTYKSSPVIL